MLTWKWKESPGRSWGQRKHPNTPLTGSSAGMRHLAIMAPLNSFPSSGIRTQPSTKGTLDAQEDSFTATRVELQIIQEVGQVPLKISMFIHHWGIHLRLSPRAKATSHFSFSWGSERGHTCRCRSLWHSSLHEFSSPLARFWLSFVVFHLIREVASTEFLVSVALWFGSAWDASESLVQNKTSLRHARQPDCPSCSGCQRSSLVTSLLANSWHSEK